MSFALHPVLARDTLPVRSLTLSELLLMNDARFPWCILVPRIAETSEWHHLPSSAQQTLSEEISLVSSFIEALPEVTKLNVGALGNRVPQLHVHVLGRHPEDAAWPDPVWGHGTPIPYRVGEAEALIESIRSVVPG